MKLTQNQYTGTEDKIPNEHVPGSSYIVSEVDNEQLYVFNDAGEPVLLAASSSESNYTLPTATDSILGGVIIDNDTITISDSVVTANYPAKQSTTAMNLYWDYHWEEFGVDRDEADYADPGYGAVDFSIAYTEGGYGASGQSSFASGLNIIASGYGSRAHGEDVVSSGDHSTSFGSIITNSSFAGFASGYDINLTASGYAALFGVNCESDTTGGMMAGIGLLSTSGTSTAIFGAANEEVQGYGGGTNTGQPMIIIGNGTHNSLSGNWTAITRSNLLVGLRNGEVTLPSTTTSVIDSESTGKILVTREWIEAQSFGSSTLQDVTDNGSSTTNDITFSDGTYGATLSNGTLSSDITLTLPNAAGTIALTSDITTDTLQTVTDNGNTTTNSVEIDGTLSLGGTSQLVISGIENSISFGDSNTIANSLGYQECNILISGNTADGWTGNSMPNGGAANFMIGELNVINTSSTAYGNYNFVSGWNNSVTDTFSSMVVGTQSDVAGSYSYSIGLDNTCGISDSFVMHTYGTKLISNQAGMTVVGVGNTERTASTSVLSTSNARFVVGIGTISAISAIDGTVTLATQADGFSVIADGTVIADSLTTTLIDDESTGRVLTTREWVEENSLLDVLVENDTDISSTYTIDYAEGATWLMSMTADTTFSETNLPTSGTNTQVITLYIDGSFTPTWPTAWNNITGTYDTSVLNQIVVEYINSTTYWVTINQVG